MKNNYLFTLVFGFLTISVVSAQDLEPRFGFRVGANYSQIASLSFDVINIEGKQLAPVSSSIEDARLGFTAGFFMEYRFTDQISVQPELQYSTEGNQDGELRLNYVQLPIFFKYNISEIFNVHLGPQIGVKVWEWERNSNFSTFQFSGIGGLGANITDNFFADLRYSFAFTELFEDDAIIDITVRDEGPKTIQGKEETVVSFDRSTKLVNLTGTGSYLQFTLGYRL